MCIVYLSMQFCIYNGKLMEAAKCAIPHNSRGLLYGDGVFETIKCKSNQILFAKEHFDRLLKGLMILQFDIPQNFTQIELLKQVNQVIKKNEHEKLSRIRITAYRAEGDLYNFQNPFPQYIIQSSPIQQTNEGLNKEGLVLGIYEHVKKSCDMLSNLKHNNFLPFVMAAMHCKQQQWHDAIILNTFGRVCETSNANIFLVKNNIVYTPSLKEGCIAGIIRQHIITSLATNNIKVRESKITLPQLMDAEEVFLTNSINEMRWVKCIGNKKFSNKFIKHIYKMINPTFG